MDRSKHVGVIGAGECPDSVYQIARHVGRGIARNGWLLVCGGLGGVMEGAARGCLEAGGMTIGILPGLEKESANPYIKIPLPTGLGEGRNFLVVRSSDVLVSIAGSYGTLSEIALALKTGKPVIGINTWENLEGVQYVSDPQEAIGRVNQILSRRG
jgi:uncharacterized protein (TIGR00725 family)